MLNFFRGGPLDGAAYQTSTMLDASEGELGWTNQLAEYVWTPDVIVSDKTGSSARVWVHNTQVPPDLAEKLRQTARKTPAASPSGNAAKAGSSGPAQHDEENRMATLEDRRKSLKLSRKQVATQADITESKVYRIEKEGAKTTDEEKTAVSEALDALEVSQAAAAEEKAAADKVKADEKAAKDAEKAAAAAAASADPA